MHEFQWCDYFLWFGSGSVNSQGFFQLAFLEQGGVYVDAQKACVSVHVKSEWKKALLGVCAGFACGIPAYVALQLPISKEYLDKLREYSIDEYDRVVGIAKQALVDQGVPPVPSRSPIPSGGSSPAPAQPSTSHHYARCNSNTYTSASPHIPTRDITMPFSSFGQQLPFEPKQQALPVVSRDRDSAEEATVAIPEVQNRLSRAMSWREKWWSKAFGCTDDFNIRVSLNPAFLQIGADQGKKLIQDSKSHDRCNVKRRACEKITQDKTIAGLYAYVDAFFPDCKVTCELDVTWWPYWKVAQDQFSRNVKIAYDDLGQLRVCVPRKAIYLLPQVSILAAALQEGNIFHCFSTGIKFQKIFMIHSKLFLLNFLFEIVNRCHATISCWPFGKSRRCVARRGSRILTELSISVDFHAHTVNYFELFIGISLL